VTISDGLTQGTKVIGHALHSMTIVADAEVSLLEDVKPDVELQNTRLAVAEELSLDHEPHLTCGLRWFSNDLMEFRREGDEDPCHQDDVQSSPIDRRINDIREDVVDQGVAMKREKHEVTSMLVVG
jgi:hypothetical protein